MYLRIVEKKKAQEIYVFKRVFRVLVGSWGRFMHNQVTEDL